MCRNLPENLSSNRRDFALDILKGIGIICVVLGHTLTGNNNIWINRFHMPLFFIASGCLYSFGKEISIKKRFRSLMIPYFTFSFIWFMYWAFFESYYRPCVGKLFLYPSPLSNLSLKTQHFINIFLVVNGHESFTYNVVMWFLPCLFICIVIYKFTSKLTHYYEFLVYVVFIYLFIAVRFFYHTLPWYIDIALILTPLLSIGRHIYIWLHVVSTSKLKYGILILCIFLFFELSKRFCFLLGLKGGVVSSIPLLYIIPVLAFVAIYIISSMIDKHTKFIRYILVWIGQNSLLLMLIHDPIKRMIIKFVSLLSSCNAEAIRNEFPYNIIIVFVTILCCVPFVWVISTRMNWMIGKSTASTKYIQ